MTFVWHDSTPNCQRMIPFQIANAAVHLRFAMFVFVQRHLIKASIASCMHGIQPKRLRRLNDGRDTRS